MLRFLSAFIAAAALIPAPGNPPRRAPGFSIPDSKMIQHDLQDYRGKFVILDIMQTHCPHCAQFTDVLEKAAAKYGTRVAILSIVVPPDTQATVQEYIAAHKITFPILFDCGQVAASYLRITPQNPTIQVPHVFVINRQGTIVADHGYGAGTEKLFEAPEFFAEIDKLVAPSK